MGCRMLTERQYETLRGYEHGHPSWVNGAVSDRVVLRLLELGHLRVAKAGESEPWYQITPEGKQALASFRDRYGVPA